MDSGKIAFQMAALEKKYSRSGISTGIDSFTKIGKDRKISVKEAVGSVTVKVTGAADNLGNKIANGVTNLVGKVKSIKLW